MRNVSGELINLAGVTFSNGSESFIVVGSLRLQNQDTQVFAASADAVPGDAYVYSGMELTNGTGTLTMSAAGTLIDRVDYSAVEGWPLLPGASLSLDLGADIAERADPASWCSDVVPYGATDRGSPGAGNLLCANYDRPCADDFDCGGEFVVCDRQFSTSFTEDGTCGASGTCDRSALDTSDCAAMGMVCVGGACFVEE